jgi:hypothetical protein
MDPRAKDGYEKLPTYTKCKQLASFTTTLVSNFRAYFDYEDLTDAKLLPGLYR